MTVAIPAADNNREAQADSRFGRAPWFYIRRADGTDSFAPNTQNLNAAQGAGIQSAQNVLAQDANVVLTEHCGPKAFKVLSAGGVRIFAIPRGVALTEALAAYDRGELTELSGADVEGHWV